MWIVAAVLSTAVFGLVSVLDKQLIAKYMHSVRTFNLWVGISNLAFGAAAWAITPPPVASDPAAVLWGLGSGFIWGLGILCLFLAMRSDEVSRIIPVYHVSPVFVAMIAIPFLDERLSAAQWGAGAVIVLGAVLAAVRTTQNLGKRRFSLGPSFWLLILGALLTAVAQVMSKVALANLSAMEALGPRGIGLALPFAYFLRGDTLRHLVADLKRPSSRWLLILSESVLAPIAIVLTIVAIASGPVSLVSAVTGVRPLFVFFYTTILSLPLIAFMHEPLERRTLVVKLVAIAMVTTGIVALAVL